VRSVPFGCIRDCLVALWNSVENGPNYCKCSCHEVASEFFATNAPDPLHLTIKWYFSRTIWVHSRPFGCLTKLGGERAELVQKFVPRSCIGICPNERTRSTPLDPKLTFWRVFHTIWVHSGPFGCLTKLGAKRAELVHMFVPRSRVRIFRNERTRSTPLDPKMTF